MNSDIEIEFAVNGYILRTGIDGSRVFRTVGELAEFLSNNLDGFHNASMKVRLDEKEFKEYMDLFDT